VSAYAGRLPRAPGSPGLGRLALRAFALVFLVVIGLSFLTSFLAGPVVTAPCSNGQPCGAPPSVPAVVRETSWRSSQYGFSVEYPGSVVTVSQQGPGGLVLTTGINGGGGALVIQGFPLGTTPSQAIAEQVRSLQGVSQLARDSNPAHQLLGAGVGSLPGAGEAYVADLTSPQGSQPADLVAEAATNGRVTVSVMVVGATTDSGRRSGLYALADLIINSVGWPQ
jgi:hypothetical protein